MTTKEEVLDAIKEMSVLELAELVKELEDAFGVSAAAPVAVAAAPAAAEEAVQEEEEQTEFNVILKDSESRGRKRKALSPGPTRSTSSRPSGRSLRSDSRRPRTWSRVLPRPSRRPSARTKPKTPRRSWRKQGAAVERPVVGLDITCLQRSILGSHPRTPSDRLFGPVAR